MELKELEYIVAVAEERSISKAADRLYLAQSSLSQFVSRYEVELGVKLSSAPPAACGPRRRGSCFCAMPARCCCNTTRSASS